MRAVRAVGEVSEQAGGSSEERREIFEAIKDALSITEKIRTTSKSYWTTKAENFHHIFKNNVGNNHGNMSRI